MIAPTSQVDDGHTFADRGSSRPINRWGSEKKPVRAGTRDLERNEEKEHFNPQLVAASLDAKS